jgi:hypothetical protein
MDRKPNAGRQDPNRLLKYVAVSAGDGIAAGWTFLLALLWLDIGGLGTLVHGSPDAVIALIILMMSFGVTFGFVGIAWRVMVMLPGED